MKPNGASYILIPVEVVRGIDATGALRLPKPRDLGRAQSRLLFSSLSPIKFDSAKSLANKLESMRPKDFRAMEDTSRANKMYASSGISELGSGRNAFEHARYLLNLSRMNGCRLRTDPSPDIELSPMFLAIRRSLASMPSLVVAGMALWIES
jgi:hypothetical protein